MCDGGNFNGNNVPWNQASPDPTIQTDLRSNSQPARYSVGGGTATNILRPITDWSTPDVFNFAIQRHYDASEHKPIAPDNVPKFISQNKQYQY